jgi:hypothetical protein
MRISRFGSTIALVICTFLPGALIPRALSAQESVDLSWSTNGPVPDTLPDLRNPNYLMGLEEIQGLLLELRRSPRDESYVTAALDGTGVNLDDLLATPLIRKDGELYAPSFPLLTSEDLRAVREISERHARDLAEEYHNHRADLERILSRYPVKQVAPGWVAFVLIGCFSLDWDGLDLTEELGYRIPFRSSGVGKVHWATESQPRELMKGIYQGSHNEYLDSNLVLTSFGDHFARVRLAFPDLVWGLGRAFPDVMWVAARSYGAEVPEEMRPALASIGRRALAELADRVGAVMMALRAGERTAEEVADIAGTSQREARALLDLLEALDYVRLDSGRYGTAIPVFSEEDRAMVQDVLSVSHDLMVEWFEESYDQLKADLTQATPLGDAVPFEDSFYYIWHYVFGITNRILVEKSMFNDPYGDDREFAGFVPVVWHRSVNASG